MKEHLRKRTFWHLFIIAASVLLLVGVGFFVVARFFTPTADQEHSINQSGIEKVVYSSSQAVPNYDNSERTVTDPSVLAQISSQLRTNSIKPSGSGSGNQQMGCTGGLQINLKVYYKDGNTQDVNIGYCAKEYYSSNSKGDLNGFYNYFIQNFVSKK